MGKTKDEFNEIEDDLDSNKIFNFDFYINLFKSKGKNLKAGPWPKQEEWNKFFMGCGVSGDSKIRCSNSKMMNVHIVLKTQNVSSLENVHISFVSNVSI